MKSILKTGILLLSLTSIQACRKEAEKPNVDIVSYQADDNSILVTTHDHSFDMTPTFDFYPKTNFTLDKIEIVVKSNQRSVFSNTYYQHPKYTYVPIIGIPAGDYTVRVKTRNIWLSMDITIN
jgi:hypothetical protein